MAAGHAPPGVLIDSRDDVVHYSPSAGRYLKMPGGAPSHHLLDLAPEPLRSQLDRCLREVRRSHQPWQSPPVMAETEDGGRPVVLQAEPAGAGEEAEGEMVFITFYEGAPRRPASDDAGNAARRHGRHARPRAGCDPAAARGGPRRHRPAPAAHPRADRGHPRACVRSFRRWWRSWSRRRRSCSRSTRSSPPPTKRTSIGSRS